MRQSCTNQTQFEYDGKHIDKRHSKLLIQIEIIAEILSIIFVKNIATVDPQYVKIGQ